MGDKNHETCIFKYFSVFIFCMMTDRQTVKVNYIQDAQNNLKFNFDTIIQKNFENGPKTHKRFR